MKKCVSSKFIEALLLSLTAVLLTGCMGGGTTGAAVQAPILMVSTLAGDGTLGYLSKFGYVDATGKAARFQSPKGMTTDGNGTIYVADSGNCVIRKITSLGVVSTFAGVQGDCRVVDGTINGALATMARFGYVNQIILTSQGNLLLSDSNTIRKIDTNGNVTTLAGKPGGTNGNPNASIDGYGTQAMFGNIEGMALDSNGMLYVSETNNVIRKVKFTGNLPPIVTTLAGLSAQWSNGWMVQNGSMGYTDGMGSAARFNSPGGIAASSDAIYVADTMNDAVRKISTTGPTAGQVTTLSDSTGTPLTFFQPNALALDTSGNLYVVDTFYYRIIKVDPTGHATTLAGVYKQSGYADGPATKALFSPIAGMTIDQKGNMYVSEMGNHIIRKIGPGYQVGGTISGLDVANGATVILQDTLDYAQDKLTVKANGTFTFDLPAAENANYAASILKAQSGQTCTISKGSGTATAQVTDIDVKCTGTAATSYALSGSVAGLAANTSLTLNNSNGDKVPVQATTGSIPFTFTAKVDANYAITVAPQPDGENCTVTGGGNNDGTGTATANVSNLAVTCTTVTYPVDIITNGLTGTLGLRNASTVNAVAGTENISLTTNTSFPTQLPLNSTYNVQIIGQPTTNQTCALSDSAGTVTGPVYILATCTPNTYAVSGQITGLTASGLQLVNNAGTLGAETLTPASTDTTFAFANLVSGYNITVAAQPTGETCSVSGGVGTATAPVTTVAVNCVSTSTSYSIGGTVSGLTASGLTLTNNGVDTTAVASGASSFTFPTATSAYNVAVATQPTGETCSVSNGTGTAAAAVSNVAVSCVANAPLTYVVNVDAPGLTSGFVTVQNGADTVSIPGTGGMSPPMTFATPIASGGSYNVTIVSQPGTAQTCSIASPSGTSTTDVTVTVTCI